VLLKDVQLRNYQVHLADRQAKPAVALELGPLNIDVQNFDSLNQSPFTLKVDSGLGKQGKIQAAGEVNLNPVSAKLKVNTQDIDLRVAQSYISPFIRLELRSGMLGSNLDVNLKSTEPLAQITGRAQVEQLHTLDTLKTRDFLKWQRLVLEGVNYQHGESLSIDKVNLLQPYVRFMINDDRTTNVDDLLIPQPAEQRRQVSRQTGQQKAAGHSYRADRDQRRFGQLRRLQPDAQLRHRHSTAQRADRHHRQPPGQTGQRRHQGQGRPLRAGDHQRRVNPFDPMASLDIATSFKRVELTTLTPYSGKFAGFRIRKGRLNLDLHYLITNGQLKAENKVVVEQLQLGEKVDSPDAVTCRSAWRWPCSRTSMARSPSNCRSPATSTTRSSA
jgi:hypothetical protein